LVQLASDISSVLKPLKEGGNSMTQEGFKRKLAAILSADVVAYSRLMGEDEEATVRTLNEYRGVMTTLIQQHSGRVLDSKGDNLLAEFSSVVEAVLCAVAVQKEIKARNGKLSKDRRMEFRIGVNLGDVIDNGESIYGDGVNIAARLESLAHPGGICISKTTFDHIESKLPFGYEYMGDQTVKNIAKPVPAYRVVMEAKSAGRVLYKKRPTLKILSWAAIALVVVIIAAITIRNFIWRPVPAPLDVALEEEITFKPSEKPSIEEERGIKVQLIFWESIKNSKDQKMYQEYLKKFPNGIFVGLAKINIAKLSQQDAGPTKASGRQKDEMNRTMSHLAQKKQFGSTMKEVSPKKPSDENYEIIFWKSIEDSKNIEMFQEYLRRFPNGVFIGLAKIKIKALKEVESEKFVALAKPKEEEKKKIPIVAEESAKFDTQPSKESPKKAESVKEKKDAQIEETKKLKDIEKKKDEKKTALHLPQEKEDEEVVKTAQPPEELKSDNTIEIAVFPWRFNIMAYSSYANKKSATAESIDGLSQVLNEYKLVVPKFSYYDLGNAKNIKGNPLTEAIVNDVWIKKGIFSKSKVNLDLICRLGRQLQVDAVLIYSIYLDTMKQTADIILIDIKTKKAYSKMEGVYVKTLSSDIKELTENSFIDYVNEKYKSHPNYELIFWDFIKNSQNAKVFKQYLIKFPDGTFAGLAKLRIQNLSSIKP
jgi:adenylate cyclase